MRSIPGKEIAADCPAEDIAEVAEVCEIADVCDVCDVCEIPEDVEDAEEAPAISTQEIPADPPGEGVTEFGDVCGVCEFADKKEEALTTEPENCHPKLLSQEWESSKRLPPAEFELASRQGKRRILPLNDGKHLNLGPKTSIPCTYIRHIPLNVREAILLLNTRGKKYVFASGIYPLNIIYLSRN
jgi:hypothetical protein